MTTACRVCLEDEADLASPLVSACACSGSAGRVCVACLLKMVAYRHHNKTVCEICQVAYYGVGAAEQRVAVNTDDQAINLMRPLADVIADVARTIKMVRGVIVGCMTAVFFVMFLFVFRRGTDLFWAFMAPAADLASLHTVQIDGYYRDTTNILLLSLMAPFVLYLILSAITGP